MFPPQRQNRSFPPQEIRPPDDDAKAEEHEQQLDALARGARPGRGRSRWVRVWRGPDFGCVRVVGGLDPCRLGSGERMDRSLVHVRGERGRGSSCAL